MRRRSFSPVPAALVEEIDLAVAAVDDAAVALSEAVHKQAPLVDRRVAHRDLEHAYTRADGLLREAARLARPHSYRAWRRWRGRLSRLSTAKQKHLFATRDDAAVIPLGSVRAVDTGMSGPAVGDLLHGRSREPGAPARYGMDVDAALGVLG